MEKKMATPMKPVPPVVKKVRTQLTISCGCGFRPQTPTEAQSHAQEFKHVLTLHGVIGPVEKLTGGRIL